jgi:hypothetical protein
MISETEGATLRIQMGVRFGGTRGLKSFHMSRVNSRSECRAQRPCCDDHKSRQREKCAQDVRRS